MEKNQMDIDARKAAQAYIDSMSEEELTNLKNEFRMAMDSLLDKEVEKLENYKNSLELEQQKLKANREEYKNISIDGSSDKIRNNWTEREAIQGMISIRESQILNQENVVNALSNKGTLTEITDKKGVVHKAIADFREINTNEILFDEDNILTIAKPGYIPNINEESFKVKGYVFDAIRIAKDSYILSTDSYKDNISVEYSQPFVILTLDQLVLTLDYYYKKAKALSIQEAQRQTKRQEDYYDSLPAERRERFLNQKNFYFSLPAAVKKKISQEEYERLDLSGKEALYKPFKRYGPKKLSSKLEDDSMWGSFHRMYERFINPEAITRDKNGNPDPKGRYANAEVFQYWIQFREMMNFKIKDIRIQREDLSETYKKAVETSFGESNVNDILKDKYGILVKRQNGDPINPFEITQISSAWEKVQSTYGNLKPNALKYNLKISHAGKKLIFSQKAIGVYIPDMGTIGVSDKFGDKQFESTMSHEVAHFIDNFIGELNGKRWATDDYESAAGVLAFTFRNNMNKSKNEQSDYINATKECFARAFQQFFGHQMYGDDAVVIQDAREGEASTPMYVASNFVNKENFETKIKPLVQKFLDENADVFKTTFDIDETNEIEPIGSETKIAETNVNPTEDIAALIEGLEILADSSDDTDKQELLDVIEGLKLLL
jgi:hypothetical protein